MCEHLLLYATRSEMGQSSTRPTSSKVHPENEQEQQLYGMNGVDDGTRTRGGFPFRAKIVSALEQFDQQQLRSRTHPLVGSASQHCSLIRGGSGLSTYAEECTLQVERRTLPGELPENVIEEFEVVIRSTSEEAQVRLLLHRPPLTCDANAKIANSVRAAATSVTGKIPEILGVSYWMDAALIANAGIPTVNYGPSGAGAHEAAEWVDLNSVVSTAEILMEATRTFCSLSQKAETGPSRFGDIPGTRKTYLGMCSRESYAVFAVKKEVPNELLSVSSS